MNYRTLGKTGIKVSEVALGCRPIAGLTSPGTNDKDSLAAIRACFELGINHLTVVRRPHDATSRDAARGRLEL